MGTDGTSNGNGKITLKDLDKRLRDVEKLLAEYKALYKILQMSMALNLFFLGHMSRAYIKLF
jgi:hypothetical protein